MHEQPLGEPALGEPDFVARVRRRLGWQRLAAVALVTLLLSLVAFASPVLPGFFSPLEIALAWLEHLAELALIALALLLGYAFIDTLLPHRLPLRGLVTASLLLAQSAGLAILLHAYYAGGFEHLPPALRMAADSLRWGLPAVFMTLIGDVHRRALQIDSEAHAAELARAQLEHAESEQQLALLQAQIEPHFLFNVLGNVRRLYRMQPAAGGEAIDALMRYLRTALPRLRSRHTTLGDELASVRAYLDLFQLRMGSQLAFSIEAPDELKSLRFPPMLVVTLVENAIKHGLEPVRGGRITVRARRRGASVEVSVEDDGAGFGAAAVSGTGVGLVNIRRQLVARYRNRASLSLRSADPRGACATISIPIHAADSEWRRAASQPEPC